ncbi:MAG: hypothetical protein H6835_02755 [Planctomycetes bacterium]|nr:hypothetical protein [Planctomycetota bacterium]
MPEPRRSLSVSLVAALTLSAAAAQEPTPAAPRSVAPFGAQVECRVLHDQDGAAAARRTLWVAYHDDAGPLRDHAQLLADLMLKHREAGVAIGVLLPTEAATRLAAQHPGFVVASCDAELQPDVALVVGCHGVDDAQWSTTSLDGAIDLLAMLDGDTQAFTEAEGTLQNLLGNVADGTGDFGPWVEQCLKSWPHSGRARACAALYRWWCKGDVAGAAQLVDEGLKALADDPVATTTFVDLVQRGDRFDPEVAKKLAMAMAPAAAAAPDGRFTQLVYLRALLRAGQDRLAGRLAATLPKKLDQRPYELLVLAETLTDLSAGAMYAEVAERAVQRAETLGADAQWVVAARHKCLTRAGRPEEAARLMAQHRGTNTSVSTLNNDCWYMMVRPDTMGRFDTYALAQADEMWRQDGDGMSAGNKDTVALAFFLNGRIERAIELQSAAAQANGNDPEYVGRLTRYRNTLAAQQARAAAGK